MSLSKKAASPSHTNLTNYLFTFTLFESPKKSEKTKKNNFRKRGKVNKPFSTRQQLATKYNYLQQHLCRNSTAELIAKAKRGIIHSFRQNTKLTNEIIE